VTPLHLAAEGGFADTCEALVKLGADVTIRDYVSEMRYSEMTISL
jgi:ankyrin repeat protein